MAYKFASFGLGIFGGNIIIGVNGWAYMVLSAPFVGLGCFAFLEKGDGVLKFQNYTICEVACFLAHFSYCLFCTNKLCARCLSTVLNISTYIVLFIRAKYIAVRIGFSSIPFLLWFLSTYRSLVIQFFGRV